MGTAVIPYAQVCNNETDCHGDGSDEADCVCPDGHVRPLQDRVTIRKRSCDGCLTILRAF